MYDQTYFVEDKKNRKKKHKEENIDWTLSFRTINLYLLSHISSMNTISRLPVWNGCFAELFHAFSDTAI